MTIGDSLPEVTMTDVASQCKACASSELTELDAEICIHFPGLKGLNVEPFFVFPILILCLDCGFIQSTLSDKELKRVRQGKEKINKASA
jgi:hypothetical protein